MKTNHLRQRDFSNNILPFERNKYSTQKILEQVSKFKSCNKFDNFDLDELETSPRLLKKVSGFTENMMSEYIMNLDRYCYWWAGVKLNILKLGTTIVVSTQSTGMLRRWHMLCQVAQS